MPAVFQTNLFSDDINRVQHRCLSNSSDYRRIAATLFDLGKRCLSSGNYSLAVRKIFISSTAQNTTSAFCFRLHGKWLSEI
jgi:hypothetical protein